MMTQLPQAGFSVHNLKMEPTEDLSQPKFVKPEEVERPLEGTSTSASSPSPSNYDFSDLPKHTDSKPVKKRKSWGQELPEPTTNLPPRKRAKTEAEREQRRIERVKRNRQAAHNSRERKRQEHDVILSEKNTLVNECNRLRALLDEANAKIAILQAGGSFESNLEPVPELTISNTSPPSSSSSKDNSPVLTDFTSPPTEYSPYTPDQVVIKEFETTQQPAALLCDLQCRSILCFQLIQRELFLALQSTVWTMALSTWTNLQPTTFPTTLSYSAKNINRWRQPLNVQPLPLRV